MLVLSRKENQRIMISHDIVVTVLGIRGNKVRLGIDAPEGILVAREEVYRLRQPPGAADPKPVIAATGSVTPGR